MKKILFTSSLILLLFSCGENKSQDKPIIKNAVDNADSSLDTSFESGRGESAVDKIYSELMKNDKKLQALKDRIETIDEEADRVVSEYNDIIYKSETYYSSANSLAKTVTDSLTKKEVEKEIKNSSDQYTLKIKNIKDLIEKIQANRVKVADLYAVFKIRKTLPEIEKYQKAHPLKTDSLQNFINKQNQLINELKNLK